MIDVGPSADKESEKKVPPPPTIAAFREKVETLHFTNGADAPVVAGLYEKMLRAALGGATQLTFVNAGWGDAEAEAFAGSLPLCTRLKTLQLGGNKEISAAGWMALARALREGAAPELEMLLISETNWSSADDALRVLGQMKAPKLKALEMSKSFVNVAALVEGMQAGSWPSLETLEISDNEQASDEGAEALARALERGAMPKLKRVSARGEADGSGTFSKAGTAAIKKARPGVKVD